MSSSQFFERPRSGERAVLVHPIFANQQNADLEEFKELVDSAGVEAVAVLSTVRPVPDSKFLIGSGKVEETRQAVEMFTADVVLFNHTLSPSQQRNLEKMLQCCVLDRTGLILDIFAQRARSFEGKLQVELAQLKHIATRLVRGWTHLERQKGGIGLRGPGETQLETDRRLVGQRIKQLEKNLEKVNQRRQLSRNSRTKAKVPTVSLVGYTNAGKSTLFNYLTNAGVYVANQLFATLDPTLRRIHFPLVGDIVLADTVGFIRDLPHDLVAAFRSTLQETQEADLLLHVVDVSDENRDFNIQQVNTVLEQIHADSVPSILVFNKIDISGHPVQCINNSDDKIEAVYVSAATGAGVEVLRNVIKKFFQQKVISGWIQLQPHEGRFRALLYEFGEVLKEKNDKDGILHLYITIELERLQHLGIAIERIKSTDVLPFESEAVAVIAQAH